MPNNQSASALRWFAIVLLVIGAIVTDPAGGLVFTMLAGLGALGAIALGDRRLKLIGLLILAVSVSLAVAYWPAAKNQMAMYQERTKSAAPKNHTPADVPEKR